MAHPGQGHIAAATCGTTLTTQLLLGDASLHVLPTKEERLRILYLVCSTLPRTAEEMHKRVRRLSCAQADRCAAVIQC